MVILEADKLIPCPFCLFDKHVFPQAPRMSAPLNPKNLPENPTADDILNAFLDYPLGPKSKLET